MRVEIRMATLEDAQALSELARKSFIGTYGASNTADNMRRYLEENFGREIQAREIVDPRRRTLLSHVDDALVGYGQLLAGPPDPAVQEIPAIQISHLHVDRQWHGRGVAPLIMQAALDTARQMGFPTIWLGVWEKNAKAIAFYRKWKFREVGSQIFVLGDERQRDLVLERDTSWAGHTGP